MSPQRYLAKATVLLIVISMASLGCKSNEQPPAPAVYPQVPAGYPQPAAPVAQPQYPAGQPVQPTQPAAPIQNPMAMLGQAMGGQPVGVQPGAVAQVPWQSLSQALPISTPGWATDGQIKGESANIMGMAISQASCKLKQGNMSADVQIVDTTMNPMIAMPFNMARTMRLDSSEERIGPISYGTSPGIQKFDKKRNEAEVIIMVSNRIMITITVKNAANEAAASGIGQYVNFAHLAKLVGG